MCLTFARFDRPRLGAWSSPSLNPRLQLPNADQLGLFGLTGVLVKLLQYGIGVDLWNVSAEDGARFTKVSIGSLWKELFAKDSSVVFWQV